MGWAWFGLAVAYLVVAMIGVGHLGRIADALQAERKRRSSSSTATRR
jgi:hypothetical protein